MTDSPIIKALTEEFAGKRLDVVLAELFPEYSRSRLKIWIDQGNVLVYHTQVKPKYKVIGDEMLKLKVKSIESEQQN